MLYGFLRKGVVIFNTDIDADGVDDLSVASG